MPFRGGKKKKKKKLGPNCVNPNYALKKNSNPNTFTKLKKLGFTKNCQPQYVYKPKIKVYKNPTNPNYVYQKN